VVAEDLNSNDHDSFARDLSAPFVAGRIAFRVGLGIDHALHGLARVHASIPLRGVFFLPLPLDSLLLPFDVPLGGLGRLFAPNLGHVSAVRFDEIPSEPRYCALCPRALVEVDHVLPRFWNHVHRVVCHCC
jgi:hypothetical protein